MGAIYVAVFVFPVSAAITSMRLPLAHSWYLKRYPPISKQHVPNNNPGPFLPISCSHVAFFLGHVWWFTPCWNCLSPLVLAHKSAEPKLDEQLSLACQNILRLVKNLQCYQVFSIWSSLKAFRHLSKAAFNSEWWADSCKWGSKDNHLIHARVWGFSGFLPSGIMLLLAHHTSMMIKAWCGNFKISSKIQWECWHVGNHPSPPSQ